MQVWHISGMAYHPGWDELGHSLRNSIPSRVADPKIVADLYNRYLDEWALCDELGLNIMVNEHHASATCLDSVCTVPLAILARETKKVRLRSEEHTSELQSLMRISYAVFCLKKNRTKTTKKIQQ